MNRKEWFEACYNHVPGITYWRDRCEGIRKTLQYNENPNAIHKHHLFNTPEQIAYNNEHYELWGFEIDENGNASFEYGKYIIFVTPEEHSQIHASSDETNEKRSIAMKRIWANSEYRQKTVESMRNSMTSLRRYKISKNNSKYWKGKHLPNIVKQKISNAKSGIKQHAYAVEKRRLSLKERWKNKEYKDKMSNIFKERWKNKEYKDKMSNIFKERWKDKEYKDRMSNIVKERWADEEYKDKMSNVFKERWEDEEYKDKMSNVFKERWKDEEYKDKMSNIFKERWEDEEYRVNFTNKNLGKHFMTDEHKEALRRVNTGRVMTDETKAKLRESLKSCDRSKSKQCRLAYIEHKANGGNLLWNEFQRQYFKKV